MDAAGNAAGTGNMNAPVSARGSATAKGPVMTDEELMREALKALKEVDEELIPTVLGDCPLSMVGRRARAVIANLEQRLLKE